MEALSHLPIFLVVFIDVLGFTIVYPLIPFYVEHFAASPSTATMLVSVYALCAFVSTPLISRLSDYLGRRRLLLVSQVGTCLGLLVLASADALWLVFVGRVIDGLTAGNLTVAQAYISDRTPVHARTKALAAINVAFSIGFFVGPAIGGRLSSYGLNVPFLCAACLSAGAVCCSYLLLDADPPKPVCPAQSLPSGSLQLASYLSYLRRASLRSLYLQFFLSSFAFSSAASGFALFCERRFVTRDGGAWTPREVGLVLAYSGALGIVLNAGVLGRLVKWLGDARLAVSGFAAMLVAYVVLGPASTLVGLLVASTLSAFGGGVLRSVIVSQITQRSAAQEQGVAIGISGSLNSLAMIIAPLPSGYLLDRHWLVAWALVPAVAALLGLLAALRSHQPTMPA